MSDPTQPASEQAPLDAEGFRASLVQQLEQRTQGLAAGYQKQAEQLSQPADPDLGDMTEAERAAMAEADAYIAELQSQAGQATAADLARRFPNAMSVYERLRAAQDSPEQWLSILEEAVGYDASAHVPAVDPNNPPASPPVSQEGVYLGRDGQAYDKQMRREILQRLSAGGTTMADLLKGARR